MEFLGVAFAISIAALGSGIGQGLAAASAMGAMARQPEMSGEIRTTMLLSFAFMETLTLFGFVMSILLWVKL